MTEQPPIPEQGAHGIETFELGPAVMSVTIGRLATALAKAQGEILSAPKDSKNPHFNSRYADLASIREACRVPLSSNGLSVVQVPNHQNGEVTVLTILSHASGEFISGSLTMRPQQATPQGIGSCITYARRYALASMVGVAPDDDDANAASGQQQSQGAQQQRPAAPQQTRTRQTSAAPPQSAAAPPPASPAPAPAAPPVAAPHPQAPPAAATPPATQGPSAPSPAAPAGRPANEIPALRPKRLYDAWIANGYPEAELLGWLESRGIKLGGTVDAKTLDLWEAEIERRQAAAPPPTQPAPPAPERPAAQAPAPPAPAAPGAAPEEEVIF